MELAYKRLGLALCCIFVAKAGMAGSSATRLNDTVIVGLGSATTKSITFDTSSSPNASITTTPSTGMQLVGSSFSAINAGGDSRLTLGSNVAGGYSDLLLKGSVSTINWAIGSNIHTAAGLEFTPSTAGGGTTFTTPTMMLLGANVGIGSNAPAASLDVTGSFAVSGGSIQPYIDTSDSGSNKTNITMTSAGSKYGTIQNEAIGGTGAWSLGYQSAPSAASGTNVLTWTGSAAVGINTTAPAASLEVVNTMRASRTGSPSQYGEIFGGDGSTNPHLNFSGDGEIWRAGVEKMIIQSTSISTTVPVVINGTGGNTPHACTRRTNAAAGTSNTQSCSGGEIVTGGGCTSSGSNGLTSSFPNSDTSWACVYNGGSSTIAAYAICCQY